MIIVKPPGRAVSFRRNPAGWLPAGNGADYSTGPKGRQIKIRGEKMRGIGNIFPFEIFPGRESPLPSARAL